MNAPESTKTTHPIRGALYGLSLGLGVAIYLVIFSVVAFSIPTTIIVVVVFIVLGILWGMFAPAKKPKGAPPAGDVTAEMAEPDVTAGPDDMTDNGGGDQAGSDSEPAV